MSGSPVPPSSRTCRRRLPTVQPGFGGVICFRRLCSDAFIQKYDRSGRVIYSSFLGGSSADDPTATTIGADGSFYVSISSSSRDFPLPAPGIPTDPKSCTDAAPYCQRDIVVKIAPDGKALAAHTVPVPVAAMACDPAGRIYIVGSVRLRVNDFPAALAVDQAGNIYVAGSTRHHDFPVTEGAYTTRWTTKPGTNASDDWNTFAIKIDPASERIVYATFLTTSGGAGAHGIAVDSTGSAFVTGTSGSSSRRRQALSSARRAANSPPFSRA